MSSAELERAERHIEDALLGTPILRSVEAQHIVDVGSGGGFPGLPLALAMPEAKFELVESQHWKAAFLRDCTSRLSLESRVRVWPERAESAVAAIGREIADAAVARAVAPPAICAEYLSPFVRVGGFLLLWTTTRLADEAVARSGAVASLGLGDPEVFDGACTLRTDGVLLLWPKVGPSSARFPRRPGMATKRPMA